MTTAGREMSAAERRLDLINLPVQGQNVYESNEAIAAVAARVGRVCLGVSGRLAMATIDP